MNRNSLSETARASQHLAPYQRKKILREKLRGFLKRPLHTVGTHFITPRLSSAFHFFYYHTRGTWEENAWFGFPIHQFPTDLYLYQEIIVATRPDYIVQTGVFDGGSALFFAHLFDLMDAPATAKVVGIDIELRPKARELTHPRIHLIEASSTAPETLRQVEDLLAEIPLENGGMVSLDSDHSDRHVSEELELYPRFVGIGQYLVVEDTTVNGRPVFRGHGPGPGEALDKWLPAHSEFERDDRLWKRQLFSAHAGGWLKRIF